MSENASPISGAASKPSHICLKQYAVNASGTSHKSLSKDLYCRHPRAAKEQVATHHDAAKSANAVMLPIMLARFVGTDDRMELLSLGYFDRVHHRAILYTDAAGHRIDGPYKMTLSDADVHDAVANQSEGNDGQNTTADVDKEKDGSQN